ncbi:hypothetical protein DL768_000411 [Monosporascus sp. mg162]|nr:hypothetical protein DL768_000411 [Monosporascus sp. mg162]
MTHGRAPVHHLWPLNHVLPKVDISDPHTFLAVKRGILQYAWLKPILSLATIIMKAAGIYQEGYIGLSSGYLWSGIIYNISVTVSLYSLGLFWVCMHNDLQPYRPVPKFLCIKLIIFASYWQGFFLSILVWLGAIPDDVQGYTQDNLAAAIQDALICIEMPAFAVAHWLPVKYAFRDAFGVVDLIEDSKETFRGDKYSYRVFDSSGKVIAHEDSSSRFARLKEGMRYKKGGEAKYWIPKPGEVRGEMSANTPLLNSTGGPSTGEPLPKYTEGSVGEAQLDRFDELLYGKARELEFGDWNANSGAWSVARSDSSISISNRPQPETAASASSVTGGKKKEKGKEKQTRSSPSPPPEPTAQVSEETQSKGPLGAPLLTTSDPQILIEEAEEEDLDLEVGEPAPREPDPWNDPTAGEDMRSPHYGIDGEDEFRNVWRR